MRTRKLGYLLATNISLALGVICILTAVVAIKVTERKYMAVEKERYAAQAYSFATRIAEVAYMSNWAFIEGNIKPLVVELPDLDYFYVTNDTRLIKVSNLLRFTGESVDNFKAILIPKGLVESKKSKFLELSDEFSSVHQSTYVLKEDLARIGAEAVKKNSRILELKYDLIRNKKSIGSVVFGFNIQSQLNDIIYAQVLSVVGAICASLALFVIILIITNKLTKPLTTMAEKLANFNQSGKSFEASLQEIDLSLWEENCEEVRILKTSIGHFRDIVLQNISEISRLRTSEAIARTTQMVAHDVRKPFSMLRAVISMLRSTKSLEEVRELIAKMLPEVDKALRSVSIMLQDIVEVGKVPKIRLEDAELIKVFDDSLSEVFSTLVHSNIEIVTEFLHSTKVMLDVNKTGRAFSNILNNAQQALSGSGRIWISAVNKTIERKEFVEIVIGNSGQPISPEDQTKLFDAFYTKDKRGGTGLGLAIAKKVMQSQGGTIWCEPNPTIGVEFKLRLPASSLQRSNDGVPLIPSNTNAYSQKFSQLRPIDSDLQVDDELRLLETITKGWQILGRHLRILLVDDETIYLSGLQILIQSSLPELANKISVVLARDYAEAILSSQLKPFDLVITDIDLGSGLYGGLEIVNKLRGSRSTPSLICVHSNRFIDEDTKKALNSGADVFIPKPMGRRNLLMLISATYDRLCSSQLL